MKKNSKRRRFRPIDSFLRLFDLRPFELHKVPGCYVVGVHGVFGSGKSLALLEHGLLLCERLSKSLVVNFPVDPVAIRAYALRKRYRFVSSQWFRIAYEPEISDFFSPRYNNRVLLLDEAGLDLFSRDWKSASRAVLFDRLFRIRHYGNVLLYASQSHSQVDKQFRDMTHLILFCNGFQRYSVFKRHPVLIVQFVTLFDSLSYQVVQSSPAFQSKVIFPLYKSGFRFLVRFVGFQSFLSFVFSRPSEFDLLFACFNSFDSYKHDRSALPPKFVLYDPKHPAFKGSRYL